MCAVISDDYDNRHRNKNIIGKEKGISMGKKKFVCKHITTFLVMLSIVLGTIYTLPETDTYAKHGHGSGYDCILSYSSNGDSGHTVTCTQSHGTCNQGYPKTESHTGSTSCSKCGWTHTHSYGSPDSNCYAYCSCGAKKKQHTYNSWLYDNNNNGTHYKHRECTQCGHLNDASKTENCNTSGTNGSCSLCGYTPPVAHTHKWGSSSEGTAQYKVYDTYCVATCLLCGEERGSSYHHAHTPGTTCSYCHTTTAGSDSCPYKKEHGVHNWGYTRTDTGHTPTNCQTCGLKWSGGEESHTFSGNICTVCKYDKTGCHFATCGCSGHDCPANDIDSCSAQCWYEVKIAKEGTPVFDENNRLVSVSGTTAYCDGCPGHKNVELIPNSMVFSGFSGNRCNYVYIVYAKFTCDLCSGGHSGYVTVPGGDGHLMQYHTYNGYKYKYKNASEHSRFQYCARSNDVTEAEFTEAHKFGRDSSVAYGDWELDPAYSPNPVTSGTKTIYHERRSYQEICSGCGYTRPAWQTREREKDKPTPVITPPPTVTPEPTDTPIPTPTGTITTPTPTGTTPVLTPVITPPPTPKTIALKDNDNSTHRYYYTDNTGYYDAGHHMVNNGTKTVSEIAGDDVNHKTSQPQRCDTTLNSSATVQTIGTLTGYTQMSSCGHTAVVTGTEPHSFKTYTKNGKSYEWLCNDNDKVNHTKVCQTSGCGHVVTSPHTFGATWTDAGGDHIKVCTGCGFVSRESHRYGSWTQGNTAEHTRTCLDCGHVDSEPHKYPSTWTRKDSSVHKHNCTVCDREETSPHDYPSTWTDKDAVNHSHICNQCTNEVTEPHHYPKYSGYDYQKVNATTHNKICDANGCKHTVSQAHNYIDIKQTEVTTDKVGYHKIIHTWKCGGNTTTGCGDTYETTEYVPYKYTVKFDANGGNAVADMTYIIGNTGYKFPGCSRTDYVFKGWLLYSDSTQKTGSAVKILVSDTDPLTNGIANSKYIKKDTAMSYDGKTADGAVFTYIAIWEHKEPKAVENSKITAKSTVYEVSKVTETGYRGYYVKGTASGALVYLDGNFKYNSATWTPYKSIMLKTKGTATNAYIRPSTVSGWTMASGSTNSGDSILPTVKVTQVVSGKSPAYPYWVEFSAKSGMITVYQSATVTDKWADGKTLPRNKDITTDSTDYVTIISDGDAPAFVTSGGGSAKTELDNIDKKNWKTTKNYPITIVSTESNTTDSGFNAGKSYITIKNITKNIEYTLKKTPVTDANGKITKYTFETFDMLNPNSLKTDLFNGEFDITWHLEDNVGNVTEGKKEYRITLTVDTLHSVTDNKDFSKADGITLKKGATGSYYVKTTGNVDKIVITYPTAWKISNKQVLNTYKGNIENISKTTELTSRTTNTITQTKNGTSPDDIIYQNNGNTSERQCFMTPIDIPKGKVTVTVTAYRGDAVKTDNLTVTILDEAVTDDVYSFITDVR